MDARIKEAIEDVLRVRTNISTDEAVEIVKLYAEKPDPVKLEEQYYKRLANRILAGIRDDQRVRDCFNVKTASGERVYVSVPNTEDVQLLELTKKSLAAKYRGINRSMKKVRNRELELMGQQSLDFGEAIEL